MRKKTWRSKLSPLAWAGAETIDWRHSYITELHRAYVLENNGLPNPLFRWRSSGRCEEDHENAPRILQNTPEVAELKVNRRSLLTGSPHNKKSSQNILLTFPIDDDFAFVFCWPSWEVRPSTISSTTPIHGVLFPLENARPSLSCAVILLVRIAARISNALGNFSSHQDWIAKVV